MRTRLPAQILKYIGLLGYVLFLATPLVWLVLTAFKSPQELGRYEPTFLPSDWTAQNFTKAFEQAQLLTSLRNSFVVAIATAAIATALSLPAAYALARYKSVIRNISIGWILLSQIFPFILIVIPVFILLRNLGLINTLPGLVLVYVVWALPFALWMLYGYAAAIPRDLEEAAATDGASRMKTLTQVIFPLLLPGLVATTMFSFISAWNEFFFALVVITDPSKQTAPLLLARYVGAEGAVDLGPLAATALITTLPSLLLFGVIQRKLIGGMLTGAVKG